jgi:hypothetical protein
MGRADNASVYNDKLEPQSSQHLAAQVCFAQYTETFDQPLFVEGANLVAENN